LDHCEPPLKSNIAINNPAQKPTKLSRPLVENFQARRPLRTGSLIVTIFGDVIAPRGGVVWLGSLIRTLAPLGISSRLTRTAVFRLVKEDILQTEHVGRRSFYSLTPSGRQQFDEATRRIYADPHPDWDNQWCLVFTHLLTSEQKETIRKQLRRLGFGNFGTDFDAHPVPDRKLMHSHLQQLDGYSDIVFMDGSLPTTETDTKVQQLVIDLWALDTLEAAYREFIEHFHPFLQTLDTGNAVNPADAFYLRTFLVHEYRKVLLRDPGLPRTLLSSTWKGHTAYQLARQLYQALTPASEDYVDMCFENQIGTLPPPTASFYERFGDYQAPPS